MKGKTNLLLRRIKNSRVPLPNSISAQFEHVDVPSWPLENATRLRQPLAVFLWTIAEGQLRKEPPPLMPRALF